MPTTFLDARHHRALRRLLERDVEANLFQLGVLERGNEGGAWIGNVDDAGEVLAAAWLGGRPGPGRPAATAVPAGEPTACIPLGRLCREHGGTAMIVGPRRAADAFWEGLGRTPSRIRYDQRLYVCDRLPPGPALPLRPPRTDEIPLVAEMGARMLVEDLRVDPRAIALDRLRDRVARRATEGRVLVAEVDGEVAFRIELAERTTRGVQVGGTFVPVHLRGRGIATRAMRGLCRRLLGAVPRVTLHCNEANLPAVRCYEAAGFRRAAPFRLVSR